MDKGSHRIVITGGIGTGKSYVARHLSTLGWALIEADVIGHAVLKHDRETFDEISRRWPSVVEGGEIQRGLLAQIVFADPEALAHLESITHPAIRREIHRRTELLSGHIVVELPVVDMLPDWPRIVVDAPEDLRIDRLVARGMDIDDAHRRMAAQPTREEWSALADFIFDNGGAIPFEDEVRRLQRWLDVRKP